jgi:hypothetical protein
MDLEKFMDYDQANPEIWQRFEQIALKLISVGRQHYGAKAIFEVIRYETVIRGDDGFKVNNNYTAGYARKFESKHPRYKGFFATREMVIK